MLVWKSKYLNAMIEGLLSSSFQSKVCSGLVSLVYLLVLTAQWMDWSP